MSKHVAHKSPWGPVQKKSQTSKRQSLLWSLVPNLFKDKIQQNQHTQQQPLQSSPAASWRQLQVPMLARGLEEERSSTGASLPYTGEAPSPQSNLTDWHLKISCPCPGLLALQKNSPCYHMSDHIPLLKHFCRAGLWLHSSSVRRHSLVGQVQPRIGTIP